MEPINEWIAMGRSAFEFVTNKYPVQGVVSENYLGRLVVGARFAPVDP
jgi:hypothetical protein